MSQGGIARQFNTEMFDSLQRTTNCNLENVVYYRGCVQSHAHGFGFAKRLLVALLFRESHYWVMTPTVESLVKTGVCVASPKPGH